MTPRMLIEGLTGCTWGHKCIQARKRRVDLLGTLRSRRIGRIDCTPVLHAVATKVSVA